MMMILLIYLLVYCLKNSSSNAFQAAEILEQKNKQVWLHAGQSNEEYFLPMRTLKEENDKWPTHL